MNCITTRTIVEHGMLPTSPRAYEKPCLKCGVIKPLEAFCIRRSRKDGRYCYCRDCETVRVTAYSADPARRAAKKAYDLARHGWVSETARARARQRYAANRDAKVAQAAAWQIANPTRRAAIASAYKHRRRAIERAGISGPEQARWTLAQVKICHWCGIDCAERFHIDHYMPLSKGGAHEITNLVIACPPCNMSKQAKDPVQFAAERAQFGEVGRNTVRPEMLAA